MAHGTSTATKPNSAWRGGVEPYKASYGKLMMWFFLVSDAFTFSTLLVVYGTLRFSSPTEWANPENVFTHVPILTEFFNMHPPLAFVGLMTFILIGSSVTMVLGVEAGHRMDKKTVEKYFILTIIGGIMFVSCQAYEWYNFIVGTPHGSIHLVEAPNVQIERHSADTANAKGPVILVESHGHTVKMVVDSVQDSVNLKGLVGTYQEDHSVRIMNGKHEGWYITKENVTALKTHPENVVKDVKGATLTINEYSQNPSFANLFFFITGFHGSHVASGVLLNYIIFMQVKRGVMHRRGHYEMVEKVGLYWHFVDLVWVFVFTFFYLI